MARPSPNKPAPKSASAPPTLANDLVAQSMRRKGIPITRENYIKMNWGRIIPPEQWTPEHEQELPRELREES